MYPELPAAMRAPAGTLPPPNPGVKQKWISPPFPFQDRFPDPDSPGSAPQQLSYKNGVETRRYPPC